MPLPRPWPRRAHQNHCLVNVRSPWLRVVVFIVFFFCCYGDEVPHSCSTYYFGSLSPFDFVKFGFDVDSVSSYSDPMRTRRGLESKATTQINEANVAPIWARCRLNVESMWVLFPYTNVTMWTPCGLDVDSSPHLERVVVYQMWTQCGLDVGSLRTLVHI